MELLLECNQRLVSTSLDESLVLQQALVEIVGCRTQGPTRKAAETPAIPPPFSRSR